MAKVSNLKDTKTAAGEEQALPQLVLSKAVRSRLLKDRLATRFVSLSGFFVVFCVFAIFFVIASEVIPLLLPVGSALRHTVGEAHKSGEVRYVGIDENRALTVSVSSEGEINFIPVDSDLSVPQLERLSLESGETVLKIIPQAASGGSSQEFLALLSSNKVIRFSLVFVQSFDGTQKKIVGAVEKAERLSFSPAELMTAALVSVEGERAIAIVDSGKSIFFRYEKESQNLMGESSVKVREDTLTFPEGTSITAVWFPGRADIAFAGDSEGKIFGVKVSATPPEYFELHRPVSSDGISSMKTLLGGQTLIVGTTNGSLRSYLLLQSGENFPYTLALHSEYPSYTSGIRDIQVSERNKGFLSLSAKGEVGLHYGTSGDTLHELKSSEAFYYVNLAPRGNGILGASADGILYDFDLDNPHPEAGWRTLFTKIWYEGRPEPEFKWQSSSGSDEYEQKLSVVPLLFGTLKGTFYALLFAVPIAVLAALYTSQFMHARLKAYIKPAVELMAALPSVVIGFIAGLWLSPRIEEYLVGLFIYPFLFVVSALCAFAFWGMLPKRVNRMFRGGKEIFILLLFCAIGIWLSFYLGQVIEDQFFAGDLKSWLSEVLGITYDQRNSLVVGIALGFAVIPLIYTISEDCISSVPKGLVASSLALGATKWQTAMRIVLPAASPGIFSAIMIGFGRAVGETMIVLMATGNTPVLDWSAFNGFRAMSANIAVELPEAPHGSTLYRVLFLTAFLLFIITFVVNMLSELVRIRLRRKYGQS